MWPPKSSLYLFRTDGMSCSREFVTGEDRMGKLQDKMGSNVCATSFNKVVSKAHHQP